VYRAASATPSDCIGEPILAALQKVFGDPYLYAGLG
jgi:hypothetical protein